MGKLAASLWVIFAVFLASCVTDSATIEATPLVLETATRVPPTTTKMPPTPTPIPPTPNALQVVMTEQALTATPGPTFTPWPAPLTQIEVSWDGKECVISGPSVVPVGYHQVTWNYSDLSYSLAFRYLQDGHTYQDLLDIQGEPGRNIQRQSWVEDVKWRAREVETTGEDIRTYHLDRAGNYGFLVWSPSSIWICGQVTAVEE